jgi:hypothetical protein
MITLTSRWTRFVVLGHPHHLVASLEIRRCCLSAENLEISVGAFEISEKLCCHDFSSSNGRLCGASLTAHFRRSGVMSQYEASVLEPDKGLSCSPFACVGIHHNKFFYLMILTLTRRLFVYGVEWKDEW